MCWKGKGVGIGKQVRCFCGGQLREEGGLEQEAASAEARLLEPALGSESTKL